MVTENLGTEYHQQDTTYYCGAACAQMILEECGAGHISQVSLYNDNHNHSVAESGWYTAPDGLAWTLNNRQSGRYFVLDALSTEDATSRIIAWTIHHYGIAPAALVYGWDHWITIRGYQATDIPAHSQDVGYSIQGFYVNNPWPPTPSTAAEPPHSTSDGCGSGSGRGVANQYVSYATWQDDYMTGVPGGHWAGKFVAVCDPDPPAERNPERIERPKSPYDGQELLDRGIAVELAAQGFKEAGLYDDEGFARALEGVEPGEPQLVQRLDRADQFYWIVPQVRDGRATAVASVDARFGDFREAGALPAAEGTALLTLDRGAIEELLYRQVHERAKRRGQLVLRPGIACISRNWVWKPCAQSLSPYYPFKQITYGADQLYLRSDGRLFTALTPAGRGI